MGRYITAALTGFLAIVVPISFVPSLESNVFSLLAVSTGIYLFMLLIPISIGVAILRSRLWDIDIIIRRTLIYGWLTGLLVLVYFGSVVLWQTIFRLFTDQSQSEVVTVVSTLVIAALFSPLRRRVQAIGDVRLATVAGLSAAVALRALGFAPAIPLGSLDRFFTIMWVGFALTVLSGTALFMADPVTKSGQPVFYVKLLFVAAALVSLQKLKTRAVTAGPAGDLAMPQVRALSVATIVFWVGATTAGRLMAYLY